MDDSIYYKRTLIKENLPSEALTRNKIDTDRAAAGV